MKKSSSHNIEKIYGQSNLSKFSVKLPVPGPISVVDSNIIRCGGFKNIHTSIHIKHKPYIVVLSYGLDKVVIVHNLYTLP